MTIAIIAVTGVFFLGMGVYALAAPVALIRPFGIELGSAISRAEVRAVYGGFGVAIAAVLAYAATAPRPFRPASSSLSVRRWPGWQPAASPPRHWVTEPRSTPTGFTPSSSVSPQQRCLRWPESGWREVIGTDFAPEHPRSVDRR